MLRHFLGWDRPVVELAAEFLLADVRGRPLDLSRLLVVVPTRQAGRRLREQLAVAAQARGTMVLSPQVVMPAAFLRPQRPAASRPECLAVLAQVLADLDYARFEALFPTSAAQQAGEFRWRLDTAEVLLDLRQSLSEGGLTLAAAAARLTASPGGPEPERWQALAELEARYRQQLHRLALTDPVDAAIETATGATLPEAIDRLVIMAVADPVPLAVRAWERLDTPARPIQVCIHAPAALAAAFDDWGRPTRELWQTNSIPIPDGCIHLAPKPADQAAVALSLLPSDCRSAAPGVLALGALDEQVLPHLETALRAAGIPVASPALRSVQEHALFHLVQDLVTLAATDEYPAFGSLLRHPHVLGHLAARTEGGEAAALLREADRLQNEHMPAAFADVRQWVGRVQGEPPVPLYGCGLAQACAVVAGWLDLLRSSRWVAGLQEVLAGLFATGPETLAPELDEVAAILIEALNQVQAARSMALISEAVDRQQDFLLYLFQRQQYAVDSPGARVDLEGWLELHWNNAPLLVLTGFNEGRVPAAVVGDAFLPDSTRARLGLPDNDTRLARDSYLLSAMLASRPRPGTCQIILGKTTTEGDVLRPSRLLFHCPRDEDLAARALRLFGPPVDPTSHTSFARGWRLGPRWQPAAEHVDVTGIREYLACPFRFYLRRVLHLEEADDRKQELTALDFGEICHAALQRLANEPSRREAVDSGPIAAFLTAAAQAEITRRYGDNPSSAVLFQAESITQRLRHAAVVLADARRAGWQVCALRGRWAEHQFELALDGTRLRARIDRIERHLGTGQYRVLDFKTSDQARSPRETHLAKARDDLPPWRVVQIGKELRCWTDLQLPLYVLMLQEVVGTASIVSAYFNLPKAVTETGISDFADLDVAILAAARRCGEGVVAAIRRGEFWPPAPTPPHPDDPFLRLAPADSWLGAFDLSAWPVAPPEAGR